MKKILAIAMILSSLLVLSTACRSELSITEEGVSGEVDVELDGQPDPGESDIAFENVNENSIRAWLERNKETLLIVAAVILVLALIFR